MKYSEVNFPTPEILENKYPNSKILVIGSGHSTKEIIPYKEKIRNYFDKIIVCNYAFQEFDSVSDFHVVSEKTSKTSVNDVHRVLNNGDFRKDVIRILNYKGIEFYNNKYNIYKTIRCVFNGKPNVKKYKYNGEEGLLHGSPGTQGFGLGSVMLCSMHLAAILGAKEIYTIGADMFFKDEYDHFYKDRVYREKYKGKKNNAHRIVKINVGGKDFHTTQYFKESSELINKMISGPFTESGIIMFDFSNGLLINSKQLDINNFFK